MFLLNQIQMRYEEGHDRTGKEIVRFGCWNGHDSPMIALYGKLSDDPSAVTIPNLHPSRSHTAENSEHLPPQEYRSKRRHPISVYGHLEAAINSKTTQT